MKFENLNLIAPILSAIKSKGYTTPTPIQIQAIPPILEGRDIMGCAQTGTGKTAAFAIPMLQKLYENKVSGKWPRGIKVLIVTPTRELAIQIGESFTDYGRGLGLDHAVIFGGVKQHAQVRKLKRGVDIVIATPGRLLDLQNQGYVPLDNLKFFTLDEADRMLDMGFVHEIKKLIKKIPPNRQSLFFSATMPDSIIKLANSMLTNPVHVSVTPDAPTAEMVDHSMYMVEKAKKKELLRHVLKDSAIPSALVFTRTKHGADKLAKFLNVSGIKTEAIHGNKSQNARQKALQNFKANQTRVLVATDIAARGIDIKELSHVINFEIPNEPETYVHRIGRTGRAKKEGTALSFCDESERDFVEDIHKLINQQIPIIESHPFHISFGPRGTGRKQVSRPRQFQRPARQQNRRSGPPRRSGFRGGRR
jgi:ATP-dependent RNA helicase RhlE